MLKLIPGILSPELLKVMMEMGHGDEIVFAAGNFPSASKAKNLIRLDGHSIPEILKAVLQFFPLDTYVDYPVCLMKVVEGDNYKPVIWKSYLTIIRDSGEPFNDFKYLERFQFYKRTEEAYAVVATGETARYANIILKKGVVIT
ncbi:MAG: fucose isomerase [Melioribacteraceae bacterium]|nr:fucose isomerase [Melioribacteraceae bacterium]